VSRNRLPKKLLDAITRLCDEADALAERREDLPAYEKYSGAWDLVPEDKGAYEVSRRILGSVGDLQFRRGSWEKALNSFLRAVQCPGGLGDPHLHLRIGQCRFELGDRGRATDELARAYMGGGREAFDGQDPKYFALVEQVLQPPPGMDRLP
jgi:hypothetical protein